MRADIVVFLNLITPKLKILSLNFIFCILYPFTQKKVQTGTCCFVGCDTPELTVSKSGKMRKVPNLFAAILQNPKFYSDGKHVCSKHAQEVGKVAKRSATARPRACSSIPNPAGGAIVGEFEQVVIMNPVSKMRVIQLAKWTVRVPAKQKRKEMCKVDAWDCRLKRGLLRVDCHTYFDATPVEHLSPTLMLQVLSYLRLNELGACAQVSRRWMLLSVRL